MENFAQRKKDGKLTTEVISDNEIVVTSKTYDGNTGEETGTREDRFLKSTLTENVAELKQQLADKQALLAEFDK